MPFGHPFPPQEPHMKQCEAVAPASTYTSSHRCLKRSVGPKSGKRRLCSHHKSMAARRPAPRA